MAGEVKAAKTALNKVAAAAAAADARQALTARMADLRGSKLGGAAATDGKHKREGESDDDTPQPATKKPKLVEVATAKEKKGKRAAKAAAKEQLRVARTKKAEADRIAKAEEDLKMRKKPVLRWDAELHLGE